MEILKLAVFLALAWFGWRYIKRRHPSQESRNTKPAEPQQWSGRIGSDVKGPPPPTASKASQKSKQMQMLHERCRDLLKPGALTGDAAAYLLLDLRDAPSSAKDANLHVLEGELESALQDRRLTVKEQQEIRFWLAMACGEDAKLPTHMGGFNDDDADEQDDSDPREAYLLEHSTLSDDGRYTFDYENGSGTQSSRRVDILYVDGDYIDAYDHDANGMRTFRKTRIQGAVTDLETGEILPAKSITRKRLGITKIDFEALDL